MDALNPIFVIPLKIIPVLRPTVTSDQVDVHRVQTLRSGRARLVFPDEACLQGLPSLRARAAPVGQDAPVGDHGDWTRSILIELTVIKSMKRNIRYTSFPSFETCSDVMNGVGFSNVFCLSRVYWFEHLKMATGFYKKPARWLCI